MNPLSTSSSNVERASKSSWLGSTSPSSRPAASAETIACASVNVFIKNTSSQPSGTRRLKIEDFIPLDRILVMKLTEVSMSSAVQRMFQVDGDSRSALFVEESRSTRLTTNGRGGFLTDQDGQYSDRDDRVATRSLRANF